VAFQGAFWIDAVSMDLLRLEVQAYDIPEALGMAEANTSLQYSRVVLDGQQPLLPVAATFTVVGADGLEDRNRTALSGCRQYRVESTLRADAGAADQRDIAARAAVEAPPPIPPGSVLELALDVKLDPRTAALGDPVQARLTRPLRDGQTILLPEGAVVAGRLVRLEQDAIPFPIYEIGLEFHTVELAGATVPIIATLDEAGPASGLLRETRRLAPTFSRKRTTRMDILVREVQRGQGILQWDGRRLPVPQGLRMKWRVEAATPAQAAHP
jgi:hypothetical protein